MPFDAYIYNTALENAVFQIFKESKNNYGSRKIHQEFKNKCIDDVLQAFNIKRSLSKKGNPYDNAVAEAAYKILKTEFAFNRIFKSLEDLKLELMDYINWYNKKKEFMGH